MIKFNHEVQLTTSVINTLLWYEIKMNCPQSQCQIPHCMNMRFYIKFIFCILQSCSLAFVIFIVMFSLSNSFIINRKETQAYVHFGQSLYRSCDALKTSKLPITARRQSLRDMIKSSTLYWRWKQDYDNGIKYC